MEVKIHPAPAILSDIKQQINPQEASASLEDRTEQFTPKHTPARLRGITEASPSPGSGRRSSSNPSATLRELPSLCSSSKMFGPLPGNRAQVSSSSKNNVHRSFTAYTFTEFRCNKCPDCHRGFPPAATLARSRLQNSKAGTMSFLPYTENAPGTHFNKSHTRHRADSQA